MDFNKKTRKLYDRELPRFFGRGERIRTFDPMVPNHVRYRTAPHPEVLTYYNVFYKKRQENRKILFGI